MSQLEALISQATAKYNQVAAHRVFDPTSISLSVYFKDSDLVLNDYYSFTNTLELNKIGTGHNYRLNTLECPLCKASTTGRSPSVVQDTMSADLRPEVDRLVVDGPLAYIVQTESNLDYPKVLIMARQHTPQYALILDIRYLQKMFDIANDHRSRIHIPGRDEHRFPITHAYAYFTRTPTTITKLIATTPNLVPMNSTINLEVGTIKCRVFRYSDLNTLHAVISRYIAILIQHTNTYSSEATLNISFTLFRSQYIIVYLTHNLTKNISGTLETPILWQLTPYTGIVEINEDYARNIVEDRDLYTDLVGTVVDSWANSYVAPPDSSNPLFASPIWTFQEDHIPQDFDDALKHRKYDILYAMFRLKGDLASRLDDTRLAYIMTSYNDDVDIRAFVLTRWLKYNPINIASPTTIGFFIQESRRTLTEFRIDAETFIDGYFSNSKKLSILKNFKNLNVDQFGKSTNKINDWLSILRRIGDASSFGMVYGGNVGMPTSGGYVPNIPIVIKGLRGRDDRTITPHNYTHNLPSVGSTTNKNWMALGYRPISTLQDGNITIAQLTQDDMNSAMYETTIGLDAVNRYRTYVPNFMMTYGMVVCPTYIPDMQTQNTKAMCSGNPAVNPGILSEPFILVESFGTQTDNARTTSHIPANQASNTDMSNILLSVFVQLFSALQVARDVSKFRHNDLHTGNVMYVRTPKNGALPHSPIFRYMFADGTHIDVSVPLLCMVIDFGTSESTDFVPTQDGIPAIQYQRSYLPRDSSLNNYINDIWSYLFSMFMNILNMNPGLVTSGNHPDRYFDPNRSKIARFYKIFFDAYKGGTLRDTVFPDGPPVLTPDTTDQFVKTMRNRHSGGSVYDDVPDHWLRPEVNFHNSIIQLEYNHIVPGRMHYIQTHNSKQYDLSTHKGVASLANDILDPTFTNVTERMKYVFGVGNVRHGRILPNAEMASIGARQANLRGLVEQFKDISRDIGFDPMILS
jgi:hypothetical protein